MSILRRFLDRFPVQHLVYGFAYGFGGSGGGGALRSSGATAAAGVNLMLVTRDAESFHRDNMHLNRADYSSLGQQLGPSAVSAVQTRFSGNVYFNDGAPIRYGVIDARDFRRELLDWSSLYAAGRLHEPVVHLLPEETGGCHGGGGDGGGSDPVWSDPIRCNLRSAVHAALLQLPGTFAETDLYATAARVSRGGGPITEVNSWLKEYRSLYRPAVGMMCLNRMLTETSETALKQDTGPGARLYHLRGLPQHLKDVLCASFDERPLHQKRFDSDSDSDVLNWRLNRLKRDVRDCLLRAHGWTVSAVGQIAKCDEDAVLAELARRDDVGLAVREAVYRIAVVSSVAQTLKNIPTVGTLRSIFHGYHELNEIMKFNK